jgi:hypothetical protein
MVIQELPLQDANQTSPYTVGASPVFIPEAILPALQFASAFSNSSAGFVPTSTLIEPILRNRTKHTHLHRVLKSL